MQSIAIGGRNIKLIAFLYDLMRDELPTGTVEEMVREVQTTKDGEPLVSCIFSNPFLAEYAQDLADRLTA